MPVKNAILARMLFLLLLISCSKEYSFEGGVQTQRPAAGVLSGAGGGCLPSTVAGLFKSGQNLTDSNYIEVQVNISQPGAYTISTDTVNGFYFRATGILSNTGIQTIRMRAYGTPQAQGAANFTVHWPGSSCLLTVPVLANGSAAAVYTLQGNGGNCLGVVSNGTYTTGVSLGASHTITVNVIVTVPGPFSITTGIVNGISFTASGSFNTTGLQVVVLQGSGTPVQAGNTGITVPGSSGNCVAAITVADPVTPPYDYFPRTAGSYWTYEIDNSSTDTARFYAAAANYTAAGTSYRIFMVNTGATDDSAGYYRRAGNSYYRYMDLGDFIGFDDPLWGEYKFLDDTATIGHNWKSQPYSGEVTIAGLQTQTMVIRFSTTIFQRHNSYAITLNTGTVTYNDVIVTEEKYERLTGGIWTDITTQVGSFRRYYARNVGLIKYEALNGAGAVTAFFELNNYQVF